MPGYLFPTGKGYSSGSTDMGDLSCVMPVVHPYAGGATGTSHGADYYISDPEAACVTNAKWQLLILKRLLENDAALAKRVIAEAKPPFPSKEAYLAYVDSLACSGDRITYGEDGSTTVRLDVIPKKENQSSLAI